jgi:hypothetical protein
VVEVAVAAEASWAVVLGAFCLVAEAIRATVAAIRLGATERSEAVI